MFMDKDIIIKIGGVDCHCDRVKDKRCSFGWCAMQVGGEQAWRIGGIMPHMTDERVRASLAREEDLSLLNEVSMKTAGVSHLEMCIQCGTCGGSCPAAMDMDHT